MGKGQVDLGAPLRSGRARHPRHHPLQRVSLWRLQLQAAAACAQSSLYGHSCSILGDRKEERGPFTGRDTGAKLQTLPRPAQSPPQQPHAAGRAQALCGPTSPGSVQRELVSEGPSASCGMQGLLPGPWLDGERH